MSKISIIGVPMDLGADRRGVDMGPSALRYADLNERLQELGNDVQDLGDIGVIIPETQHFGDPHAKYLDEIANACTHLAKMVLHVHEEGRTPLVLGGDHSIAVGTVSGMSEAFRRERNKPRTDLVRCACRLQYPGNFTQRQRARHAHGGDHGIRAARANSHLRFFAQGSAGERGHDRHS